MDVENNYFYASHLRFLLLFILTHTRFRFIKKIPTNFIDFSNMLNDISIKIYRHMSYV